MTPRSTRARRGLVVIAAVMTVAACADPLAGPSAISSTALSAALSTVPVGYGDLSSSFVGTSAAALSTESLWLGGGREAGFDRGGLMGGGLHDAFIGAIGFGRGFAHHGPFGGGVVCTGSFNVSSGRFTCDPITRNGLTINRSVAYTDAAGVVQQAFDTATTNTVNVRTMVTGTVTFTRDASASGGPGGDRHGWGHGRGPRGRLLGDTATILTATTNVESASERTVGGLATGSTERTVSGASKGTESTTGTSSRGTFTATRVAADTTRGLVIPVQANTRTYPSAGTVTRVLEATLTYDGQAPTSISRREVVTYDGTATAKVVITENGTTRTCTRPLPHGRLTCE